MNPLWFFVGFRIGEVIRQNADEIRRAWGWLAWPSRLYAQLDSLPTTEERDFNHGGSK